MKDTIYVFVQYIIVPQNNYPSFFPSFELEKPASLVKSFFDSQSMAGGESLVPINGTNEYPADYPEPHFFAELDHNSSKM